MKKKVSNNIFFLLVSILVFQNCSKGDDSAQQMAPEKSMEFIKTLGGSLNESAQSIIKTSDGGYAVLGYAQSMSGDIQNKTDTSFDYWLLKFSRDNSLEWEKTYGGSDDDRGSAIIQTLDGGYAVLGHSKSNDGDTAENAGANDFWVVKLNAQGNVSWEKSFGFLGADNGTALIQTNDNGFLLIGVLDVSASNGEGNSKTVLAKRHAGGDYWAVKLDMNGEKQWSKFFGGTFTDTPYDVVQTQDNGFLIVGSSDSNDVDIKGNKGTYDFWVVRISENGALLWEKSFGGSEIDEARGIVASNDGNYLIIGDTRSNDKDVVGNKGAADILLVKMTVSGELIWQKTFGGSSFDTARSISNTNDGGYLISGSSRSSNGDVSKNNGQNDAWVLKLDSNANLEWEKTVGGSNVDQAFDAVALDDGAVIAVGESSSSDFDINENKGFTDVLLFKIK